MNYVINKQFLWYKDCMWVKIVIIVEVKGKLWFFILKVLLLLKFIGFMMFFNVYEDV